LQRTDFQSFEQPCRASSIVKRPESKPPSRAALETRGWNAEEAIPVNINTGTSDAPALRLEINWSSVQHLPETSSGSRATDRERLEMVGARGYQGVQGGDAKLARACGLRFTQWGRVLQPSDAERVAQDVLEEGADAVALHVGTGFEDDAQMDALIKAILEAEQKHALPMYLETHRATITQDVWRTVQAVKRFPAIRFNLDFSHWYTGHEWVYGDTDAKLEFIAPVLERVRYLHGRIGNSSSMQVTLDDPDMPRHVAHFKTVWTRAMQGFLNTARAGDVLVFAPELLHPEINYARVFRDTNGKLTEESDRWLESWRLAEIAKDCFETARGSV
jgi:hypothetical protein